MKNFTVITDPGIDDIVSLVLLHKLNTKAENYLVSTFGNGEEKITSRNTKEFIAFVEPNWNYVAGSQKPFNGKVERPWPDYFHGPDGVWGVHPDVDIKNIRTLETYPTLPNVISLATLTDVYKLTQQNIPQTITIMGGVFNEEGNETKYAETNIAFDPEAAHHFFNEFSDIKVNVVPLDVTRKVHWSEQDIKDIPETNNINIWIKKMLSAWFEKYNHQREEEFNLHDPFAVYLTFFPEEAIWTESGIKVVLDGEKRGQTVMNDENYPCNIALTLTNADQIAKNIYKIVFGE